MAAALTSGPLNPAGSVTIDASAAPGLTIDGGDRVLVVDAGQTVRINNLTLTNTIVAGNANFNCVVAVNGSGAVSLTSNGNNVMTDDSCAPVDGDQVVADAGLEPLADNEGPTLTHALKPDSPAVDTASGEMCPISDQRGVARPQGEACDVGAFEFEPAPTAITGVDEPASPNDSGLHIFLPFISD